jgi:peptidoglycan/LPS O-acetylase OafA/YrhL
VDYRSFLIKRVCRIYIPYIAWVVLAILASLFFYSGHKEGLSVWFNSAWAEKPSLSLALQHFLLIPSFRNDVFNPVLWSLVHEMRLSILFPLIMIPILKFNWKVNMGFAVLATFSSFVLLYISRHILHCDNDYPVTLHYSAMFIFGALLAKHHRGLVEWHQSRSKATKHGLIVLAIVCYLFPWLLKGITNFGFRFAEEWIISMGVAIFIISALSSWSLSWFLALRPIYFLGKVSYSLYLIHAICLLSFTHLLYGRTELWVIWTLGIGCTLVLSWLSYRYIEIPSINIGKRLSTG